MHNSDPLATGPVHSCAISHPLRAYSPAAISARWTYRAHYYLCPTRYSFTPESSEACKDEVPCQRTQHRIRTAGSVIDKAPRSSHCVTSPSITTPSHSTHHSIEWVTHNLLLRGLMSMPGYLIFPVARLDLEAARSTAWRPRGQALLSWRWNILPGILLGDYDVAFNRFQVCIFWYSEPYYLLWLVWEINRNIVTWF